MKREGEGEEGERERVSIILLQDSLSKTGCGQTVKALFGQSKILTAVAALDTVPMGVTPLALQTVRNCSCSSEERERNRE